MFKLNESSGERLEIGNSMNCSQLAYASVHKYIKENQKLDNEKNEKNIIKLHQIKLFYERDECLIAIQFIMRDYSANSGHNQNTGDNMNDLNKNFNNKTKDLIFTDPKINGPIETYVAKKNIDEIVLILLFSVEVWFVIKFI
jgi:hypothetical protein